MNLDHTSEERFASWLIARDEALARGEDSAPPSPGETPPELKARLERGLACLKLLHEARPRGRANPDTPEGQNPASTLDGGACPAPAPSPAPRGPGSEPPETTRLGRFHIIRELGRGGFGVVLLAHDPQLQRDVALKVPRPDALITPELRERFQQEARAAASLDHPHIVPVHEAGEVGPICYIASAYCPGVTLADWLKQQSQPVPLATAATLVAQLAAAVQHAHDRNILHRDLKPSNVLLAISGQRSAISETAPGERSADGCLPDAIPKITDFGLAKSLSEPTGVTRTGAILGTPSYMAPEQAGGKSRKVGPAADVYALGAILYELITGRPPFRGESDLDTLHQVQADEPIPPVRLRPRTPRDLDTICLKCLQKESRQRYASAGELAADLRSFLAGRPIQARPIRAWERGVKWARRRPAVAGLLAALAVALAAGLIGTSWQALRAERARRAESEHADGEQQARLDTEREKLIAQATRDFLLRDLLHMADAMHQANTLRMGGDWFVPVENPTIKALLDRAAAELTPEKIERKFPGQPLVQAEILRTIGETYRGTGEYAKSIAHLERSRDLFAAQLGPDHSHTLAILGHLAPAHRDAGNLKEAVRLFEHLRDKKIATLGPNDATTLTTLSHLAVAYMSAGRLAEAIRLLEQVRGPMIEKLGHDHGHTMELSNSLAVMYVHAGRLPEAIRLSEQAREQMIRNLGPDHPLTLAALQNLARAYQVAGQPRESIPLFEQARDMLIEKLGPDHLHVLTTRNNLAVAFMEAGKLPEAMRLCQEVRDKSIEKLGPDHPTTLLALANLARIYKAAGKTSDAVPLLERVHQRMSEKLGPDHPDTLATLHNLAGAYAEAGRLREAILLCEQVRDKSMEKLGSDHPEFLKTLSELATFYRETGRLGEAVRLSEEVHAKRKGNLGPDHLDTLISLHNVAAAHLVAGQWRRALPLLEQALTKFKEKLGPDHDHTLTCRNSLAEAYRDAGRRDEALALHERTLAMRREKFGPNHADTLVSMANLAKAYLDAHDFDKALPLMKETVAKMKELRGPDHPGSLIAMNDLAALHWSMGKPHESIAIFEEALPLSKAKLGPLHPETLRIMANLGMGYRDAGKLADALPLLEEALAKRREKLGPNHPDTLVSMDQLAGTYQRAGKLDLALPLYERALAGFKETFGPRHPDTLISVNNLARAYRAAGKLEQALPLYEQLLVEQREKPGPDHPDTLTSMNDLAVLYWKLKKLDQSILLFEETLQRRRNKLGAGHLDTLRTMANLSINYRDAARPTDAARLAEEWLASYATLPEASQRLDWFLLEAIRIFEAAAQPAKAVPLYEHVLASRKESLGPDNRATLNSMHNLAEVYLNAGLVDKALTLHEETLAKYKEKFGPEDHATLQIMNNAGVAYWKTKQFDRSIPRFEQLLAIRTRILGESHAETIATVANLAVNYGDAGRKADAAQRAEEFWAGYRKLPEPDRKKLASFLPGLARIFEAAGSPDKAEPIYREVIDLRRQQFGSSDLRLAAPLAALGMNLLQQQKGAVAEPILRECLAISEKNEPDSWTTFNTQSMLGGALLAQKKYADAEPILIGGYEGLKQREAMVPKEKKLVLTDALERIAQLYHAWGKKNEALKCRKELEAIKKASAIGGPESVKEQRPD